MLAVHTRTGSHARLPRALSLAVAVAVALTSCSPFGSVAMKATTAANLANPNKAALLFIRGRPETERIRYTREGGFSGSGYWLRRRTRRAVGAAHPRPRRLPPEPPGRRRQRSALSRATTTASRPRHPLTTRARRAYRRPRARWMCWRRPRGVRRFPACVGRTPGARRELLERPGSGNTSGPAMSFRSARPGFAQRCLLVWAGYSSGD